MERKHRFAQSALGHHTMDREANSVLCSCLILLKPPFHSFHPSTVSL